MTTTAATGSGTREDPWNLKTPPGTSEYQMYRDAATLVCIVGKTELRYQWRCAGDLHAMLKAPRPGRGGAQSPE